MKFFRSDQPIVALMLLLLSVCIWLGSFILGSDISESLVYSRWSHYEKWINSIPWIRLVVSYIIHVGVAFFLNTVAVNNKLVQKSSYLVAFSYLLLATGTGLAFVFRGDALVSLGLVLCLHRIFQLPTINRFASIVFDSALLIGIMSVIYIENVLLSSLLITAIIMFKSITFRGAIMTVVGVGLPFLYLFSMLYLFDGLGTLENWRLKLSTAQIESKEYIILLALILLLVPSLFGVLQSYSHRVAVGRKALNLILLLLVFTSVLGGLFYEVKIIYAPIVIPLALVLGVFFDQIRKVIVAEVILLLFMAVVLYYYFS
ncbi:hypothetical protein N9R81_05930 [Flavobacteriales bacterium]|nr:hypothetical protein [Flavobacteriales bacterium]